MKVNFEVGRLEDIDAVLRDVLTLLQISDEYSGRLSDEALGNKDADNMSIADTAKQVVEPINTTLNVSRDKLESIHKDLNKAIVGAFRHATKASASQNQF